MREVAPINGGRLLTVECFSVPEAARALGKTELTMKKWIDEGMLPTPVLHDTARRYRQYSVGELRVIARVLAAHGEDFSYYAKNHIGTRERMAAEVARYRSRNV